MAIVNLRDVRVYKAFSKGFRVVEESTGRDGKTYSQRWTVWSEGIGVAEGDVISLSGFLSARVNEWTDNEQQLRHTVELSLNSPKLVTDTPTGAEPAREATITAQADSDTSTDVWGAQTGAQQNTSTDWPVAEIPDNPWPAEGPGVPF